MYLIRRGILIDVTWSLLSQFVTAATAFYLNFRIQFKLRQQIKKQFEHYLDPRQVKKLQDNPDLLKLGGERKRCTYLFTDVRGFTAMSEKLQLLLFSVQMRRHRLRRKANSSMQFS